MSLDPTRIYVGDVVAVSHRPQRKRGRRELSGPLFLFLLLAAGFIPSVLTDVDLRGLVAAIARSAAQAGDALPAMDGHEGRYGEDSSLPAFVPAAGQSADSAAIALGLPATPGTPSPTSGRNPPSRPSPFLPGAPSPRAPPLGA